MKKYLFIILVIAAFGCKKEEKDTSITYEQVNCERAIFNIENRLNNLVLWEGSENSTLPDSIKYIKYFEKWKFYSQENEGRLDTHQHGEWKIYWTWKDTNSVDSSIYKDDNINEYYFTKNDSILDLINYQYPELSTTLKIINETKSELILYYEYFDFTYHLIKI